MSTNGQGATRPKGAAPEDRRRYGLAVFAPSLLDQIDHYFPPNGDCAFCGDCILGARHRVMDGMAERVRAGEDPQRVADDYEKPVDAVAIALAGSWMHDKAISVADRKVRKALRAAAG